MHSPAEIVREYGPFPGVEAVHGVSYDGRRVWFASGDRINALDPDSGKITGGIGTAADAGTAFDGAYLYQIAETVIHRIDPGTGEIVATIPAPGNGGDSGLAWAEGSLWVGEYRARRIHRVDPDTGTVLRTIMSDRFVTGVTWIDGQLWHATWEEGGSDIRRIDPETGRPLQYLDMPPGSGVSGLEADDTGLFFCGGGEAGTVRAVRRPKAISR